MSRKPSIACILTPTNAGAVPSTAVIANTIANTVRVQQIANKNGPDERFKVNEDLLYEKEFPGNSYVSVHLQRLQNGIYDDDNLHTKEKKYVTFAAFTFVMHSSHSIDHRFVSAIISIRASTPDGKPIKVMKYAPHAAYGRMSAESLKWNFKLGANIGVTKGPVNLAIEPSESYDKEKVVGTMMKIQGSTRSTIYNGVRKPDTKLVFSLEENSQQLSGIPREFTFVCLLERPVPSSNPPPATQDGTSRFEQFERAIEQFGVEHHLLSPSKETAKHGKDAHLKGELAKTTSSLDLIDQLDSHSSAIFTPVKFSIAILPDISGEIGVSEIIGQTEESMIAAESGQRFPTEGTKDSIGKSEHDDAIVDGLYNFAKLPGEFEQLIELPGSSVTTLEPELPDLK